MPRPEIIIASGSTTKWWKTARMVLTLARKYHDVPRWGIITDDVASLPFVPGFGFTRPPEGMVSLLAFMYSDRYKQKVTLMTHASEDVGRELVGFVFNPHDALRDTEEWNPPKEMKYA